jgi:hypothetical protein
VFAASDFVCVLSTLLFTNKSKLILPPPIPIGDDDADCNLNGVCQDDGSCECFEGIDGVTFFGPRVSFLYVCLPG